MELCFQDNDTEMYLTRSEVKSVNTERFIRTLKKKMYKYNTLVSKIVYINKLDDIINECSNTYHSTVKVRPADVKSRPYIDFNREAI